jgi:hypothetical protein
LMATVRFTEQSDGDWRAVPWTILLCNVTGSRMVYPGIETLKNPAISATLRAQLTACVQRSQAVVGNLR